MKMEHEEKVLKRKEIITCIIVDILICAIGIGYFKTDIQSITLTQILMYLLGFTFIDTLIVWLYNLCNP